MTYHPPPQKKNCIWMQANTVLMIWSGCMFLYHCVFYILQFKWEWLIIWNFGILKKLVIKVFSSISTFWNLLKFFVSWFFFLMWSFLCVFHGMLRKNTCALFSGYNLIHINQFYFKTMLFRPHLSFHIFYPLKLL